MFDVITIGSATRDVFIQSKDFLELKKGLGRKKFLAFPLGAKIELPGIKFTTGGGATNAAVSFARKGLSTGIICRVADDPGGRGVIEEMESEGVDTDFIQVSTRMQTAYAVILLNEKGERAILVYRGTSGDIAESAVLWEKIKTDWVYLSSVGGDLGFLRKFFSITKKEKIFVAFNPGSRELSLPRKEILPFLCQSQILIFNQEEAQKLLKKPKIQERSLWRSLKKLFPNQLVITTREKAGSVAIWQDYIYEAGIFREKAVLDRTGAGDAFGSGIVYAIIEILKIKNQKSKIFELDSDDIKEALRIGSANATSVVEFLGAKAGLLPKNDLSAQRWKKLKIKMSKLS